MTIATDQGLIDRGMKSGFYGLMVFLLAMLLGGCSQDKTAGVKNFTADDARLALKAQGIGADGDLIGLDCNGHQVLLSVAATGKPISYFLVNAKGELIGRPKSRDDFGRVDSGFWEDQKRDTQIDLTGRYSVTRHEADHSTEIELTRLQGSPAEPIRIHSERYLPASCIVNSDNEVWFYHQPPAKALVVQDLYLTHYYRTDPSVNWQIDEFALYGAILVGCDNAGKRILIDRYSSGLLLLWTNNSQWVVDLATRKETEAIFAVDGVTVFME